MTTTGEKILAQVQNLKERGNGRYRCNSPLRAESDSQSFSLYIDLDGEHGMFKDFVSGESGSLYDLARLLQIELPAIQPNLTSKHAYSGLDDYAQAHGVEGEVFRAAHWREGVLGGRSALFFETQNGTRWRFLDGGKPAYGNKSGYKSCWYGLRRAVSLAIPTGVLVLCNGEASTVVAQAFGIGAACLTNSGERSDLTPELLNELKESLGNTPPLILVAYDCDKKGRQAAPLMADYLTGNGLPARAVDLSLGIGGADLADFCMLNGDETLDRLQDRPKLAAQPEPAQNRGWQIVTRDYLRTLPPVKWVIEGEIQDHAVNVLVGPPASGKSFLAIDYAAKVAQFAPVVYMIGEGDRGINARLEAWERHHNKLTDENFYPCMGAVEIMIQGELESFLESIRTLKPKLVVVDTLARSMITGDENSSRDMKAFVAGCSTIVKELDCAVLLVHHTRKDGDVYRGSNVLEGNVDVMLAVSMQDEVIQLKSTKFKDKAASHGKFYRLLSKKMILEGEEIESAVIIPDEQYEQGERLTQNQLSILQLVADEDEPYYRRDIIESMRIPLGTVVHAVKALRKKGYLAQTEKSQPYQITDEGRKYLESLVSHESHESPVLNFSDINLSDSCDTSDTCDSSSLPAYRTKLRNIDLNHLEKSYDYLGVSDKKPRRWKDEYQLPPDLYHQLLAQGLKVEYISEVY